MAGLCGCRFRVSSGGRAFGILLYFLFIHSSCTQCESGQEEQRSPCFPLLACNPRTPPPQLRLLGRCRRGFFDDGCAPSGGAGGRAGAWPAAVTAAPARIIARDRAAGRPPAEQGKRSLDIAVHPPKPWALAPVSCACERRCTRRMPSLPAAAARGAAAPPLAPVPSRSPEEAGTRPTLRPQP